MFCPVCGQENAVPGISCQHCGAVLPRSRGATVVIDQEETEAPPTAAPAFAPPNPVAYAPPPAALAYAPPPAAPAHAPPPPAVAPAFQPSPAQPYPGAVVPASPVPTDPFAQTAYAPGNAAPPPYGPAQPVEWSPAPPDSRRGLVWRGVLGSVSLMLGVPLVLLFPFVVVGATILQYNVRADLLTLAAAVALVGVVEIVAGARVLKGSPSPLTTYIVELVLQFLTFTLFTILAMSDFSRIDAEAVLAGVAVVLVPLLLPLLRLIPMLVSFSGEILGTRGSGGLPMRPVPFVLWAPTTTLLASPLLASAALGLLAAAVIVWIDPPDESYAMAAGISAGTLFVAVLLTSLFAASIGLLKRARWSIAIGGVCGVLLGLAALALHVTFVFALSESRGFAGDDISVSSVISIATTGLLVPSIVWFVGAIKFRFRRPGYLEEPDGATRKNLMHLLVPQDTQ